jgi:hypothetical protein
MGKARNVYQNLAEKPENKPLEGPGHGGRIASEWILKKWAGIV